MEKENIAENEQPLEEIAVDSVEHAKQEASIQSVGDTAVSDEPSTEDTEQAKLAAKLVNAEQKAAEYLDGWQRAQASFANFRKRTEAENLNLRKAANAALLARLLPIADDFERAFQSMPEDLKGNAWLEGFSMIQRKVISVLESENVQAIALDMGDLFDPMFHQAILYQEVVGFDEGQIVAVIEQGYILGERVLRPAKVVVAKAPIVPEPATELATVDADEDIIEATIGVDTDASLDDGPANAPEV